MKIVNIALVLLALLGYSCAQERQATKAEGLASVEVPSKEHLAVLLDSVFTSEQEPIRLRDEMMKKYGNESKEAQKYSDIYHANHVINEDKVTHLLDTYGWPEKSLIGERGNRTICNVIQHSDLEIKQRYLPMMKQAVLDKHLDPALLVRTEDRVATETGRPQIYGGQMKFYPETKSFNVWPVYDPVNIDKRRAEIGLGPIAEHLKNRFDFVWDLAEQIKRSEEFEAARLIGEE